MLVCGERRGAFFRRICMSKVLNFWENSKSFKQKLNQRVGIFIVVSLELYESCLKQIENYGEYNFQNISVLEKVTILGNNILYRWWSWLGSTLQEMVNVCVYIYACVGCVYLGPEWLSGGWFLVESILRRTFFEKFYSILLLWGGRVTELKSPVC